VAGETKRAAALLDETRGAIGRHYMAAGRIGARLVFLRSGMFFRQGKIADGNAALAAAMSYMRHGSHWLFQIGLADRLYMEGSTVEGGVTARTAMELYAEVLRDPGATDWTTRPMESLAVLTTPHPAPFEHWFEVAFDKRNDPLAALEIADRCRRHRYFSSLPFGGRLQSLRWILAGPGGALDREAELHRRDLLARFVDYDKFAGQAKQIRARLEAMPLVVHDAEALRQQKEALAALGNVSRLQEAVLREIAVRREPAGLIFPPLHTTDTIQQSLPKGHALLVFFATKRHLYGFLINQQKYTSWRVGAPAALARRIAGMLRDMGQYEQNRELSVKELADTAWKKSGKKVFDAILKGSKADFATQFDELIIVPDGLLWYVPFEALQVRVEKESHSLISRVRIRYAPTASLAIPDRRGRKPMGNTAVVVGRLFPRDDKAVAQKAFDELAAVLPGAVALPTPLPAPSSVYGVLLDRLIVLDDLLPPKNGPYSWAPIQIDRGRPGNTLDDWLSLPWGGPQTMILPGYHTRWRTGGRTSFELVREFAQELPHTTPPDAWQRAVLLVTDSPLHLKAEPRIKRTAAADDLPKAEHPLFWAGYMLVDSGTVPEQPAAKPSEAE
jgi:CHAT domain-containing protein